MQQQRPAGDPGRAFSIMTAGFAGTPWQTFN
jgi:hypothetical protein